MIIIREVHIKTTTRSHLTLVRIAIIKKSTNNNAGEGVEKREPSYTVGGNVNPCRHDGEQYGGSSFLSLRKPKKKKIDFPCNPAIPLLGIYPD